MTARRALKQELECRQEERPATAGVWLPKDAGVLFEHLKCAAAPTADQRQRSGSALSGIKSH